jgi:peptide deformylase
MAARQILKYPNPGLRLAAASIEVFDDTLGQLAEDLLDTMHAAQGIGITAPHIGVAKRLMVIQLADAEAPRYYVNPQVVWTSTQMRGHREGSVSMQDVLEEIERPDRVRVSYRDLAGAAKIEEADGLLSTCLQHEIDQLDGVFWLDRLSRLRRDRVIKRFEKLQRHQS